MLLTKLCLTSFHNVKVYQIPKKKKQNAHIQVILIGFTVQIYYKKLE
jgi:hypothetical protein